MAHRRKRVRRAKEEGGAHPLRRPPAGARPGTLAIPPDAVPPRMYLLKFSPESVEERAVDVGAAVAAVKAARARTAEDVGARGGVTWLDVQGLGEEALLRVLAEVLTLHPLTLEDVVHTHQRPKVELFDGHIVAMTRMVRLVERELTNEQVTVVFGRGWVVTFQEHYGDVLEPLRERIRQGKGAMRTAGSDYLTYAILDAILDGYFPVVEELGDRLEDLEDQVVERPSKDCLREINELKRQLGQLRRAVWPQREAVGVLLREDSPLVTSSVRTYLRDVQDHAIQLADLLETYREFAGGLLNTYLSSIANRQNEVMKVLTIMASIFIPLSFLAGLYGMNFDFMPELHWHWSYFIVLGLMLGLSVLQLVLFRRRGWIGEP